MLVNFTVENYRSIRDKAVLSMEAYTRDRRNKETLITSDGLNLLPVACVYGQNASGKTILLEAIGVAKVLVTRSKEFQKGMGLESYCFLFDEESAKKPTRFSFEFINKKRFVYSMSLLGGNVEEERLCSEKKMIFKRTGDSLKVGDSVPKDEKKKIEFVMSLTNENCLLLSKCSQSKVDSVEDEYDWFNGKINMMKGDRTKEPDAQRMKAALSEYRPKIMDMMNRADLGLSDISVDRIDIPTNTPIPENVKQIESMRETGISLDGSGQYELIRAEHDIVRGRKKKKCSLLFKDESDGTRKMANLVIAWIKALETGGLLVVDEMECCLHPHLVDFLIDYITDKKTNTKGAQLVFASHDPEAAKRNRFRRDQVWFASRDPSIGSTTLYSWLDYDVRSDLEFAENYLAGRFGAVPHVKRIGEDI
jgi:AAA15 family ATPase/GTPase